LTSGRLSPPGAVGGDDDIIFEGVLTRKHALESATKKTSNRKWEKLYITVKSGAVYTYKDHKHYIQDPRKTYKGEPGIDLRGASIEVPADYSNKKHNNVFRLRQHNGGEYLFEARDEEDMSTWITRLRQALPGSPSRVQTLPARLDSEKREVESKRRGFFTLKKK
jgi:spectrin beta